MPPLDAGALRARLGGVLDVLATLPNSTSRRVLVAQAERLWPAGPAYQRSAFPPPDALCGPGDAIARALAWCGGELDELERQVQEREDGQHGRSTVAPAAPRGQLR